MSPIGAVWTESVSFLQERIDQASLLVFDIEPATAPVLPFARFRGITDDPEILSKTSFRHPVRITWEIVSDPYDEAAPMTTKEAVLSVTDAFESELLDLSSYGYNVRVQYAESVDLDGVAVGESGETLHVALVTILFDVV